jgi:hypothetical protein
VKRAGLIGCNRQGLATAKAQARVVFDHPIDTSRKI